VKSPEGDENKNYGGDAIEVIGRASFRSGLRDGQLSHPGLESAKLILSAFCGK